LLSHTAIGSSTCLFWVVDTGTNVVATCFPKNDLVQLCGRLPMNGSCPAEGMDQQKLLIKKTLL
jgi:hypothetical protein